MPAMSSENVGRDAALHGMGLARLGLCHLAEAVALFERPLALRPVGQIPGEPRAETAFALARALARQGRDQERACALGHEAASIYRQAGARFRARRDEAERWLRTGRCPRPS
jgi:hypothetical protein